MNFEFQIITDFDYTLTKSHVDGTRCSTCYGVIENYSRMPPKFKTETRNLFEKFYPIEIDPHMTEEEKVPLMIQWYDESHDLILQVLKLFIFQRLTYSPLFIFLLVQLNQERLYFNG